MTARFLNRVTGAMSRMASTIKCRASNPRHIIQCREMSEKQDDTYKERCTDDGQFFKGCFKKEPRKKCPEVQERPKKAAAIIHARTDIVGKLNRILERIETQMMQMAC